MKTALIVIAVILFFVGVVALTHHNMGEREFVVFQEQEEIQYRCVDGATPCLGKRVPGVLRYTFWRETYGGSPTGRQREQTYWAPCHKVSHEPDIELCRRVGASPERDVVTAGGPALACDSATSFLAVSTQKAEAP